MYCASFGHSIFDGMLPLAWAMADLNATTTDSQIWFAGEPPSHPCAINTQARAWMQAISTRAAKPADERSPSAVAAAMCGKRCCHVKMLLAGVANRGFGWQHASQTKHRLSGLHAFRALAFRQLVDEKHRYLSPRDKPVRVLIVQRQERICDFDTGMAEAVVKRVVPAAIVSFVTLENRTIHSQAALYHNASVVLAVDASHSVVDMTFARNGTALLAIACGHRVGDRTDKTEHESLWPLWRSLFHVAVVPSTRRNGSFIDIDERELSDRVTEAVAALG